MVKWQSLPQSLAFETPVQAFRLHSLRRSNFGAI